jgi:putative DNA primase/helicase
MVEFTQRAAGYSFTGDIREHLLFLCHGRGANGKSTLLNALRATLGDYSTNTPFSTFELNQSSATNDVAALDGLRFVTASETSETKRINEARVKAITGGDPVTARFLFGEFFTYRPTYKVWLAMNHRPGITGTDEGIWRRIRLIPFDVSFLGREDKTLAQELEAERQGILAWAVQGALKWQAGGLTEPAAVLAATEAYRRESDLLAQFLDDCTIQKAGARVKAGDLYKAYTAWCKDNNEKELTGTTFGRRMKEREVDSVKQSGNVWYLDIGLIAPAEGP